MSMLGTQKFKIKSGIDYATGMSKAGFPLNIVILQICKVNINLIPNLIIILVELTIANEPCQVACFYKWIRVKF